MCGFQAKLNETGLMLQFMIFAPVTELFILEDEQGYRLKTYFLKS